MQTNLQELFSSYRSAEAFWAAAENVMTDSYSRKFRSYLEQAIEEGSERAAQYKLNEMIFGSDYATANPEKALRIIDNYLDSQTDEPDPYYYLPSDHPCGRH